MTMGWDNFIELCVISLTDKGLDVSTWLTEKDGVTEWWGVLEAKGKMFGQMIFENEEIFQFFSGAPVRKSTSVMDK